MGYVPGVTLPIAPPFAPMEAQPARELPPPGSALYEPKWDGFRCIAFRDGAQVYLQSKAGQPLTRYFPEIVAALSALRKERFVIDGELVVPVEDRLDFEQLQQRIHPAASRVAMLAETFPATFLVFDVLADADEELWKRPLRERRERLTEFAREFGTHATLRLSPATQDPHVMQRWLESVGGALDGIIAKRLDAPYASGERTAAVKVKRMRSADCVVGGYRASKDGKSVASLLLGLYDERGGLDYVGFTSGFDAKEKRALLDRVRALRGPSEFTVRSPGGQSRWNRGKPESEWFALRAELVLEVEFDHVSNGRFRHGTKPLRFRQDKDPKQCTVDQLQQPQGLLPFTLSVAGE